MQELVYARLREDILNGRLVPGQWVRQDAIAREMQISKIPIREALRRLESDGYVYFEPNRGAKVSELSVEELQELYVERAALETFAARLAGPLLLDADVVALRESITLQEQLRHQRDNENLSKVTKEFHFVIYRRSGRERLCSKIGRLWDNCGRYQRAYLDLPDGTFRTIEGHHAMVEACENRDTAALEIAVRDHILAIAAGVEAALSRRYLHPSDPTISR